MSSNLSKVISNDEIRKILEELDRTKGKIYLDNAGACLYPKCLIEAISKDLLENVYQNPHSDQSTADCIDQIRYTILDQFNTTPKEYSVIFTSGTTAALKLVAEYFLFSNEINETKDKQGCFTYLVDNHTSLIGLREIVKNRNASILAIAQNEFLDAIQYNSPDEVIEYSDGNALLAFSLQSNFNGFKLPLNFNTPIKSGVLNKVTKSQQNNSYINWFTLVDVAAYTSTNKLDLSVDKPDFLCLSFYKIFGYPTGLGALLVKNSSENLLQKNYFGGGTVEIVLNNEDFHVKRKTLHERFEDGTVSFLSIIALKHCFDTWNKLIPKKINNNVFDTISYHTFYLAKDLYSKLKELKHTNGRNAVEIYCDTSFEDPLRQGGIIAFNLLRSDGLYIGYSEVQHMANLFNICLRTGCHCNTGSCQRHLVLSSETLKAMHRAGHVCGDDKDLLFGRPTGCVRVSFGYYNTFDDVDALIEMITRCFVNNKQSIETDRSHVLINANLDECKLKTIQGIKTEIAVNNFVANNDSFDNSLEINIYPIKSCGAFKVHDSWKICIRGFEYDREWMIVKSNGTCLTQKQCTRMCLLKPAIDLKKKILILRFPGKTPLQLPLETNYEINLDVSLCQSKVCTDNVQAYDYGQDASNWISEALEIPALRLVRQCPDDSRSLKNNDVKLNLSNQAQYLLVNRTTVKWLKNKITNEYFNESVSSLADRFRGNIIIETGKELEEREWELVTIGNHQFVCYSEVGKNVDVSYCVSFRDLKYLRVLNSDLKLIVLQNKVDGPCNRCSMVCIDQNTGEKTVEPLRTISKVFSGKLKFGMYLTYYGNMDGSNDDILDCKSTVCPEYSNRNVSR